MSKFLEEGWQKKGKQRLTWELPISLWKEIQRLAKSAGVSPSEWLRQIVAERVEREMNKEGRA